MSAATYPCQCAGRTGVGRSKQEAAGPTFDLGSLPGAQDPSRGFWRGKWIDGEGCEVRGTNQICQQGADAALGCVSERRNRAIGIAEASATGKLQARNAGARKTSAERNRRRAEERS